MTKVTKSKHVPIRTCIVTKVRKPKKELIRIVRTDDDKLKIDLKGKVQGRGANIDMEPELLDQAFKKGLLKRALKLERSISDSEKEKLKKEFIEAIEEKKFRDGKKSVKIRVSKEDLKKLKS
jgi:hypothetical protein